MTVSNTVAHISSTTMFIYSVPVRSANSWHFEGFSELGICAENSHRFWRRWSSAKSFHQKHNNNLIIANTKKFIHPNSLVIRLCLPCLLKKFFFPRMKTAFSFKNCVALDWHLVSWCLSFTTVSEAMMIPTAQRHLRLLSVMSLSWTAAVRASTKCKTLSLLWEVNPVIQLQNSSRGPCPCRKNCPCDSRVMISSPVAKVFGSPFW